MPYGTADLVNAENKQGQPNEEKTLLLRDWKMFLVHKNTKQKVQGGRKILQKTGCSQIDLTRAADKKQKRGQGDQARADQQEGCRF